MRRHLSRLFRPPRPSVLVICLLLAPSVAGALPGSDSVPAEIRFETLSIEDGLPQPSVLSILQDRHGFLWLATQGGAVRYDGYRTKVFRHDHEDPGSISANRIWKIFEDHEGILWLGTSEGGLNRFESESETFRALRHERGQPSSLASDRVWEIFEDREERLWVGTSGGLSLLDRATKTFSHWTFAPSSAAMGSPETVRAILEDRSGDLWIGTSWWGLIRFDPAAGAPVASYRHDPGDPLSLPDDQVLALHLDAAGSLWVGTGGGLARFDEETSSFRVYRHDPADPSSLAGDQVQAVFEDRSGRLWIGTDQGISSWSRESGRFDDFRHDPARPHSLPNDSVEEIYQDRSGILWFGTWYGGAARADPLTWPFLTFFRGLDASRSTPGGVLALLEDPSGAVWIGGTEGLARLDPETRSFLRYSGAAAGEEQIDVTALAMDDQGHVWAAFRTGRLEKWDPSGSRIGIVDLGLEGGRRGYVNALCRGAGGTLWVAQEGLVEVGPEGRIRRFHHRPGDPESPASNRLRSLAPGRAGSLWIGYSDRGVGRFDPAAERFEHFRLYPRTDGQPTVNAMLEDERGHVWVATNAGLFRLSDAAAGGMGVRSYSQRRGLASDLVAAVLADGKGRLWLSTAAGLSSFDPETELFRNFGTADGALPGGYNKSAAWRAGDGRMIFGGAEGMTLFRPGEIRQDPSPPLLAWTDLRLDNRSVPVDPTGAGPLERPIHLAEEIVLDPADDVVSFEFAALHFADPSANRYAYQMQGLDRDWIATDASRRVATYTHLPPGRFTLKVRAGNQDGIWNDEGISLRVEVLPPWWRSGWAHLLYATAALALVGAVILTRRRLEATIAARTAEVRRQARRLQAERDAKARFIAHVAHEFRTPLTLISGPLEELRSQTGTGLGRAARSSLEVASRNVRRLMGLVGQVLDMGRLEAGRFRLRPVDADLADLLEREAACFSVEAQRRGVHLESRTPPRPVELAFDPDAMDKVISNLLMNAVKYTPRGGSVEARLEDKGREVVLEVTDTGRGIAEEDLPQVFERYFQSTRTDTSQPGTGIGLALVRELVELHGGTVEARSRLEEGSVFTVVLPRRGAPRDDAVHAPDAEPSALVPLSLPESPASGNGVDQESAGAGEGGEDRQQILIVDDNSELRDFLELRLSASYRVLQAADGEEALEIARREFPDLIVSDVMMPVLDGFAMVERLRRDPEIAFIPVLLLTARAARRDVIEGLQHGADDYLSKPFDPAELAARIAGLIASRRRLGEHLCRQLERQSRLPDRSETFDDRVRRTIEENLGDQSFNVKDLAAALALDRTVLFRKVRDRFGQPPSKLIRQHRLERAAELLRVQEGNVTEVCYAVGFSNLSYFTRRFRERYGVPPSRFGQTSSR